MMLVWVSVLLTLLIIASAMALINKISFLAVILYCTENEIELPTDNSMRKYTAKAAKKILHMPK